MTSSMDNDTKESFPSTTQLSHSAPSFALLSEKGDSVDIDINTGLPKLPVELPPADSYSLQTGPKKSVTFRPELQQLAESQLLIMSNKSHKTTSSARTAPVLRSPLVNRKVSEDRHSLVETSRSVDDTHVPTVLERGKNGRHTLPLKNRSRSVFIRLQLPSARTPPLPHRNLSILGESDSSDADIQTAPLVESSTKPFFLYDETGRRASGDGVNLRDKKGKLELSEISTPPDEPILSSQMLCDTPSTAGYNNSVGRRGSYLYLSDADEDEQIVTRSRASSMSSHIGDETYVTPFAQILANLQRVRTQFLTLLSLPQETRTSYSRTNTHILPSPSTSPPKKLAEPLQKKLAMQTLEEFDWCLKKLESVNSASMGTMAQDKFRRMLSRELSHMSGKSRSGTHVAEWVQNITDLDMGSSVVDRALDTTAMQHDEDDLSDKLYLEEARLSGSLSHDVWSKLTRRVNTTRPHTAGLCLENADYCVRVPIFGVYDPKMDKPAMREFMLKELDVWDVDTFHLDTISSGNALISASYLVFKKRDLFLTFKISPHIFINFISKIQSSYFPNPYHNKVHAADVLLATNYLLKAEALDGVFTDLEIMAALVAAAIHDVGHPARTNQFLVNVQHDLALLYNDNSVLENHHLALAFKVLQDPQCNFLERFDRDQRQAFRRMVIDMVLATDMAKHFKHLGELKTLLETHKVANDGILVLDKYSDRSEVLQCMIHCADLSNPTKREDLAATWSRRIMEENFLQGDEEKSLSIPLNPLGDREQVSLYKCQVTFIDFIVYPLWETWAELVYPAGQLMLENIARTREYWSRMVDPNSPTPSDQESEQESEKGPSNRNENCVSNGPTANCTNGKKVDEKAVCDNSSRTLTSCRMASTDSDTLTSFVESPVSDRRHSFKTMKNFKALEDSMS